MKKLCILFVFLITIGAFSQRKHHDKPEFTAEQKTQLMVKKMTLALKLSDKQASQISPIIMDQLKEREAKKGEHQKRKENKEHAEKLSKDEMFKKAMAHLDKRIKLNGQMEKILTEEQYNKWEKMSARHMHQSKRNHKGGHDSEKRRRHHTEEEA